MPEKAPTPRRPPPQIHPVSLWPTPDTTDRLFYVEKDGDLPKNKSWSYGDAYSDAVTYPNHKLVLVTEQTAERWSRWYYINARSNEDAYNWEHSKADIGGVEFDAITRTYVSLRSSYTPLTPLMGANMPLIPAAVFGATGANYNATDFVLAKRKQMRLGQELDALFVVEQRVYVKRCTITNIGYDELTGGNLYSKRILYYRTEEIAGTPVENLFADETDAYWGINASGYFREGKQLSCDWFQTVERQVVPATYVDGETALHDYFTTENYSWPDVLLALDVMVWETKGKNWERTGETATRSTVAPIYRRYAHRGPCKARVEVYWQPAKFDEAEMIVEYMRPLPIYYASPIFPLNISACLHPYVWARSDTGTYDPVYEQNANSFRSWEATKDVDGNDQVDWPATIIKSDTQAPFRGGYLRRKITVYAPV